MIPAHHRPAPHVLTAHLIVVSVVFGVDRGPRMKYKHLRPPGHPRSTSIFVAIIGDDGAHMLLHSPIDMSLPRNAFPERMRTLQLIVVCFVVVSIQYLPPSSSTFAIKNPCNLGRAGQVNDPCPSSPGATCSHNPFDCCVGDPW
jgi:hypothetical protein